MRNAYFSLQGTQVRGLLNVKGHRHVVCAMLFHNIYKYLNLLI